MDWADRGVLVNGKKSSYVIDYKIDQGAFGSLWRATDQQDRKKHVALKIEIKTDSPKPQLQNEEKVYLKLQEREKQKGMKQGFPRLIETFKGR